MIIPGKGLSGIDLGMHCQTLIAAIQQENYADIRVQAHKYRLYEYIIRNSLSLFIDIYTGKLVRIDVYHQFKGKYQSIGIGSSVKDLTTICPDIYFDEHYLLVGKNNDLILKTTYEDDITSLVAIEDHVITHITLELMGWRELV